MPRLGISDIRIEHHPTGLGIGVPAPRISWRFSCAEGEIPENWTQSRYEIEIERPRRSPAVRIFRVESNSSILNPWPDVGLESRENARVRVRAHGVSRSAHDTAFEPTAHSTEWSQWQHAEAELLSREDWVARCIGAPGDKQTRETERQNGVIRPVRLRRSFRLPEDFGLPSRARLYITCLGIYEAYLNGCRIGDEHMSPGWTSYDSRLQYQVLDVTALLSPDGANMLAVEIAEGWYAGRLLWGEGRRCVWGDRIGVIAQLEVFPQDPHLAPFQLVSDDTWSYRSSPILSSSIYDGEVYDVGLEEARWNSAAPSPQSSGAWRSPSEALRFPDVSLEASAAPPVRVTQIVKPVRVFRSPTGRTLVDFGQNLVGRVQISQLHRPEGHRVQLRHAEVLEHGELGVRPLRAARATDTVIFGGDGTLRRWSPRFTFHGFRYVEIEGWRAEDETEPLTPESVSALVLHTDMQRTGFFECSNEKVNRLHQNIVWSTRGNFLSIPTDCPQRDERLGWTGDIQVYSPTASFLYDCGGMLGNWMRDVIADQKACGGIVPLVVPNALGSDPPWGTVSQAVWDDVVVLLPWVLYSWFGDVDMLRESFPGMQSHLDSGVPRGEDGL